MKTFVLLIILFPICIVLIILFAFIYKKASRGDSFYCRLLIQKDLREKWIKNYKPAFWVLQARFWIRKGLHKTTSYIWNTKNPNLSYKRLEYTGYKCYQVDGLLLTNIGQIGNNTCVIIKLINGKKDTNKIDFTILKKSIPDRFSIKISGNENYKTIESILIVDPKYETNPPICIYYECEKSVTTDDLISALKILDINVKKSIDKIVYN